MSLDSLLRSACALQRPTTTKDVSGGRTLTYEVVDGMGAVACDLQPASSSVQFRFMQQGQVVTHTLLFGTDVGARAGDRFAVGCRRFLVIPGGYQPPPPGYVSWPAAAHVQEIPDTP